MNNILKEKKIVLKNVRKALHVQIKRLQGLYRHTQVEVGWVFLDNF